MSQIDKCLREVNLSSTQYPVVKKLQICKCGPQLLAPANLIVVNSCLGPGRKPICSLSARIVLLYKTAAAFFPSLTHNFPCNLDWILQKHYRASSWRKNIWFNLTETKFDIKVILFTVLRIIPQALTLTPALPPFSKCPNYFCHLFLTSSTMFFFFTHFCDIFCRHLP